MTTTSRNQIISELKSRIKLLEKQKVGAEQHMQEKLLLWLVSESIQQANNPDELLFSILERISVILDVPLSACCKISDKRLIPIQVYNFAEQGKIRNCGFTIGRQIEAELDEGPVILEKGSDKFSLMRFEKDFESYPLVVAMFPFQSLYVPFGVFVFFEKEKKKHQFTSQSVVLQQLISFGVEKLEKLKLEQELKDLNFSFEKELNKRSEEIQNNYNRLNQEIKELRKKERKIPRDVTRKTDSTTLLQSFLRSIGVEIRTPLNGIMGFAELMRQNDLKQDERNTFIDIIKSCGKSLMKIVDDAHEYSTIRSGHTKLNKTEFALAPFMTDLYDQYKKDELYRQRENLELKISININGSTKISADRDKLLLILTNLLGNAIKFTGSGYIEFGCNVEQTKKKRSKTTNQDIVFFVKDSGIGISKEHVDKVFQEFYKVEHEISKLYGGLGLGLTIAKELVEMMGGTIWFSSEQDKGTAFYLKIPEAVILSQAELDALNGNGVEKPFDWSDKTILIVEDDAMSVIYLKEALKSTGAGIIYAGNGTKAVELAGSDTPIDIILMDIKLPGISGFEATKQIRAFSDVPIIAQTAYAMTDDYKKIITVGCDDYVSKPINRRKLLTKINDIFIKLDLSLDN